MTGRRKSPCSISGKVAARLDRSEPTTPDAVAAWIHAHARERDRFADVYNASEQHRLAHGAGCDVYPTGNGPLLGAMVAATAATRILEIGCGLGYSALWLARGTQSSGTVVTCETSSLHASLAREQLQQHGEGSWITIREGRASDLLASDPESASYDFVFSDGDPDRYQDEFADVMRLLRPRGTLLTSNLFLGIYVPDAPYLEQAAAHRLRLLEDERLQTAFLPGGLALSVKLS